MVRLGWSGLAIIATLTCATAVAAQSVRVEPLPTRPVVPNTGPTLGAPTPLPLTPKLGDPTLAPTLVLPKPPTPAVPIARPMPRKCWCFDRRPNGSSTRSKCATECCKGDRNDDRC